MKAVLPYVYTVVREQSGKAGKGSVRIRSALVDFVDVDVPVVAASDVTLLASWNALPAFPRRPEERLGRSCAIWNDELYMKVLDDNGFAMRYLPHARLTPLDPDNLRALAFGAGIFGTLALPDVERTTLSAAFCGSGASSSAEGGKVGTNVEARRAVARECAASLVKIGSEIWRKVPSISFVLAPSKWDENEILCSIEVGAHGYDREGKPSGTPAPPMSRRYGLNEYAKLQGYAGEGKKLTETFACYMPAARLPAAYTVDSDRLYLREAVGYAVEAARGEIGGLDADAVNDWLFLGRGIEDLKAEEPKSETDYYEYALGRLALAVRDPKLSAGLAEIVAAFNDRRSRFEDDLIETSPIPAR